MESFAFLSRIFQKTTHKIGKLFRDREELQSHCKICVRIGQKECNRAKKMKNSMWAQILMTLLKNAKNGQNGHHSIKSTLLSQSRTV